MKMIATLGPEYSYSHEACLKIQESDVKFFTNVSKVLAGGDCVLGSKSVVDAVAHGKIIADQIYDFLK